MHSEFVELYRDDILSMVGNTVPAGLPGAGRKIDWNDPSDPLVRADTGEGAFLERQLELIESKVYEYKLRELKFRRLFPVSNEGAGAETIAYDIIRGSGLAKIITSGADDLPLADTFVDRHYAVVRVLGISFGYTTRELRNAAFANVPLEARRGMAARRGMEEKLSAIAWNGDASHDLYGVLNNPNVPQEEAAAPATGSLKTWAGGDKTPMEIIEDISNAITRIVNTTNQVHHPDTLVLPVSQYEYIRKTPYSDRVPMSILRYITDPQNGFGITTIEQCPELAASGPGGEDQMLVYERSEEVLQLRIPMEMKAMPPEQRGLKFLINMEAECAGLVIRYPLALDFTYGI